MGLITYHSPRTLLCVGVAFAGLYPAIGSAQPLAETSLTQEGKGLGKGDWLVRGGIVGMLPIDETSDVGLLGGEIETPPTLLPDLSISYFFTDYLAVEAQGGVLASKPKLRNTLIGDLEIGTIWTAAVSASLQYHFRPRETFNPFVGAGLSVSWPISIEPATGIQDFDVDTLTSPFLQIGADYQISENWFTQASAEYVFVPSQTYTSQGATFESSLDMLTLGGGLAYRF